MVIITRKLAVSFIGGPQRRSVNRESNLNAENVPKRSREKSRCLGFKRNVLSAGMIALGACSTAEAPDFSQLSPIARFFAGEGSALHPRGKREESSSEINDSSISTLATT